MKRLSIKILSFAMSLFILAGSSACSKGEEGSASAGTENTSKTGSTDNSPITISVEGLIGGKQNGVQKDDVSKYIAQKTGISINTLNVPDGAGSTEKYSAQLASGDLPDIFFNIFPIKKIVDADQIYALDDLVAKYGKNLNADPKGKAMIEANKLLSPDGKLYTIGMDRGTWDNGTGATRGIYIRWDLYKKLGYPEIKDLDGLTDVLINMQKLEPKTKDGKKTYVLGSCNGPQDLDFDIFIGALRTQGLVEHEPDFITYIDNSTRRPSSSNILKDKNSIFWKCYKNANKLYRLGLFDPDSFTQSGDQRAAKKDAGTYMCINASWDASGLNDKFQKDGETDKGMVALPASAFGFDNYQLYENTPTGERNYCISKNCKNPERAMQLLDFVSTYEFSRIANDGLEGSNWTLVNGIPTPTKEYLNRTSEEAEASQQKTGAGYYSHFCGYKSGTIEPSTKTSVNCLYSYRANHPTAVQKDFVDHFGVKTMPEVYQKDVKMYSSETVVDWGILSDDMTNYQSNFLTFKVQSEAKIIMAKTDAEFAKAQDDFIKGMNAYKVDDLYKFFTDNANASADKMEPVYQLLDSDK